MILDPIKSSVKQFFERKNWSPKTNGRGCLPAVNDRLKGLQ